MIRQTILPTFDDQDKILAIVVANPEHTTFYTNENRELLYFDIPGERFISAERWHMDRIELAIFMCEQGIDYSYISPASFAFSYWRKNFAPKQYYLLADGWRSTMCRSALYGGRAEHYRRGTYTVHRYDINAAYSWAATQLVFPIPHTLVFNYAHSWIEGMQNILTKYGVSRVVFSQSGDYPVLPLRHGGRVVYAQASHCEGTYTHTELRYALEQGVEIHEVSKQYITDQYFTHNPFTKFVDWAWNLRQSAPIGKVIANALYGRLAVNENGLYRWTPALNMTRREYAALPLESKAWYGCACIGSKTTALPNGNPLMAAMVLAGNRNRLHGMLDSDAAYCDTDCVFYTEPKGYEVGTDLGKLKYDSGEFYVAGTKSYGKKTPTGFDIKLRGISRDWRTDDDLFAAAKTQERRAIRNNRTAPYQLEGVVCE